MEKTVEYQGYTIESAPHHLVDSEKWGLRIFISVDDHRGVQTREFSADVVYATEQEADIHGITFGGHPVPAAVALKNLDEVINLIRNASDVDTARAKLMKRFKLTELQATAILDLQLRRLDPGEPELSRSLSR